MNPTAIKMPENANLGSIIDKINQRKRILQYSRECDQDEDSNSSLTTISKRSPIFDQTLEQRDIEFLVFLELKMAKMRESNYNPRPYYNETIAKILENRTTLRFSDRYEKPKHWPLPRFNPKVLGPPPGPPPKGPPKRHWLTIDLILCIEVAKVIPVFEKLQPSDKVS